MTHADRIDELLNQMTLEEKVSHRDEWASAVLYVASGLALSDRSVSLDVTCPVTWPIHGTAGRTAVTECKAWRYVQ